MFGGHLDAKSKMAAKIYVNHTLPAKNMEYFSFQRIFVFWGVCKVFIGVIYIPTNKYYFWGLNSHSIAKWTAKVQK